MSDEQIAEVLALLDEGEVIKINDKPSSTKEQNIELRRDINAALEKLRLNNAHKLRNIIQYGANHFKSIDDKMTKVLAITDKVVEAAKERKKWANLMKSQAIRTLINCGIAGCVLIATAGICSIILGIKV